jgi:hypothetical protein
MSRLMSAVWVVQFFLLISAAVACVAWPRLVFAFLEDCETVEEPCQCDTPGGFNGDPSVACVLPRGLCTHPEDCGEPDHDHGDHLACGLQSCTTCAAILTPNKKACVIVARDRQAEGLFAFARMLAPFLLTFGLLSGHAAMREDEALRRNLSFVFAWVYVVLAMLVGTGDFSSSLFTRGDFLPRVLFAFLVTLVLFSLFSAARAEDRILRGLALFFAAGYAALAAVDVMDTKLERVAAITLGLYALDTLSAGFERLRSRLYALALGFPAVFVAIDWRTAGLFAERAPRGAAASQSMVATILGDLRPLTLGFLAVVAASAGLHAMYAAWPIDEGDRRLSGAANTRPSSLWVVWFLQGVGYLAGAVALMVARMNHANLVLHVEHHVGYARLFEEVKELYPALFVAMALLSFVGLQASREWFWRALCAIFSVFYAAVLLAMVLVGDRTLFHAWVPVVIVPVILLFGVHVRYETGFRAWFSEEVGEGPDGWILMDLVVGPLLMWKTLVTGRRATHARGVAAWGDITVLPREGASADCGCGRAPGSPDPCPTYPEHEFFEAKRPFRAQVRFANERSDDDAAADARGVAIRFSDMGSEKILFDLLLCTGAYSAASNVVEFGKIAVASGLGRAGRRWLAKDRRVLEGGIAALRRAPASYARLFYHSQTVRFWVATDNERYLVRYRLVPWPLLEDEDRGLPVSLADFVDRARRPDEQRPRDYLRSDLKMRLEATNETVSFRLQAQFHRIEQGYSVEWYNPSTDWKTTDHPWIDLAEISLSSTLSDTDAEKLAYNPDHAPQSLGTPIATGLYDYRSIADSERRVMRRVQSLRQWIIQTFGLPSRASSPLD